MTTHEDEIMINKIAQGHVSITQGEEWFLSLSTEKMRDILRLIIAFILQSGSRESDAQAAIEKSGLKPTYTPCVLLVKGRLLIQLSKILHLPQNEYIKSFHLLISLFSIADERRRNTKCNNGCSHWWHQKDFYKNETGTDL